jgi:hypothetical protein
MRPIVKEVLPEKPGVQITVDQETAVALLRMLRQEKWPRDDADAADRLNQVCYVLEDIADIDVAAR